MIAVCVASHERPARLRALLDALAAQERRADEVVVCLDDEGGEAAATAHPLRPTVLRVAPCGPGTKRNRAWRAASADLVAFTDDDCRPEPGWLAALAAAGEGGAVLQGRTVPDPDEAHLLRRRLARTQDIAPPSPWGQTCNIAYPRALLERLGGFREDVPVASGEDADLLQRALAAGAQLRPVPAAVVRHAVWARPLGATVRDAVRWRHLAAVVRRHPALRRALVLRAFLRPSHAWLALALVPRLRPLGALGWILAGRDRYGRSWRGRARAAGDLPLRLVVEGCELAACAWGGLRARTLFL